MALNSSGPLSLGGATTGQSINLELGQAATALASINATNFRTLAGVPSGQISISNFYGKSSSVGYYAYTLSGAPGSGTNAGIGSYTDSSGNTMVSLYSSYAFKINAAGTVQWAYQYSAQSVNISAGVESYNNSDSAIPYTVVLGSGAYAAGSQGVAAIVDTNGNVAGAAYAAITINQGSYASKTTVSFIYSASIGARQYSMSGLTAYFASNPGYYECGYYFPGEDFSFKNFLFGIAKISGGSFGQFTSFVFQNSTSSRNANFTNSSANDYHFYAYRGASNRIQIGGYLYTNQTYGRGPLVFSTSPAYADSGTITVSNSDIVYWAGNTVGNTAHILRITINANSTLSISNSVQATGPSWTFNDQGELTSIINDSAGNLYVAMPIRNVSDQNSRGVWVAKFNSSLTIQWQRTLFRGNSTVTGYTSNYEVRVGVGQLSISPDQSFLQFSGYYSLSGSGSTNLRMGLNLNLPVDGSKTALINVTYPANSAQYVQISYAVASASIGSPTISSGFQPDYGGGTGAPILTASGSRTAMSTPLISSGNW